MQHGAHFALDALAYKVYVRRPSDLPLIQAQMAALGAAQIVYLQADICRQDLLVEIEATGISPLALRDTAARLASSRPPSALQRLHCRARRSQATVGAGARGGSDRLQRLPWRGHVPRVPGVPVPYFIYRGEILKSDSNRPRAKLFTQTWIEPAAA